MKIGQKESSRRWEQMLSAKSEQYIAERLENERLEAQNKELRGALEECLKSMTEISYGEGAYRAMFRARKALGIT